MEMKGRLDLSIISVMKFEKNRRYDMEMKRSLNLSSVIGIKF